jgi:hypothetical protein
VERAAEAAAEPERTPPAAARPAYARPDTLRHLARAYGNRNFGRLLQRQPATAAPPAAAAPKLAKGYRGVSIKDARWQAVDDLLTWSRLGWEAREVMRTYSVPLAEADLPAGQQDTSAPAFYDAIGNVCYLNLGRPSYEISAYFVHEMHHAKQAKTGKSPPASAFPNEDEHRRKWVAMMVEEEVVGTAMGFEHKRSLEGRGLAPRDDRPVGIATYRRVYEHWRDQALSEGKEQTEAGALGRAQGLKRVRIMIANPGGRMSPELGPPGAVGESYEDFYAREFRRSPHPATP